MSENKNHHFLPQFYLRNFGSGNSIGLYNLDRRVHVPTASIPGQCQRPYLYGKDGAIEKAFRKMEGVAATVIRRLVTERVIFSPASPEHIALANFVSFQIARTPQAGERLRHANERIGDAVAKSFPAGMRGQVEQLMGTLGNPVLASLGVALGTEPLLLDLRPKLLINATNTAFITSDSPVVLLNSWCRGWRGSGVIGLACAGLQIFMPLSPEVVLLLYDDRIYHVDRPSHGTIRVMQPKAVAGINGLQLCSAGHNLYYRIGGNLRADLEGLPWRWRDQRVGTVSVERYMSPQDGSTLVVHYALQPDVKLDLGLIRVRPEMQTIPLKERARTYRPTAKELYERLDRRERSERRPLLPGQVWKLVEDETR